MKKIKHYYYNQLIQGAEARAWSYYIQKSRYFLDTNFNEKISVPLQINRLEIRQMCDAFVVNKLRLKEKIYILH